MKQKKEKKKEYIRVMRKGDINKVVFLDELSMISSLLLAFNPVRKLLTSANGKFCVCTVPSLHPSHRAHFLTPPLLLLRPSHSYWPQPQSTAGRPGTKRREKKNRFLIHTEVLFTATYRDLLCVCHQFICFDLE